MVPFGMSVKVPAGGVAPEAILFIVSAGISGVDLTTVTAVEMEIRLPDGTFASPNWDAAILSATPESITVRHIFNAGETAQLGTYGVLGLLAIPSGVVRARCTPLFVHDPFGP